MAIALLSLFAPSAARADDPDEPEGPKEPEPPVVVLSPPPPEPAPPSEPDPSPPPQERTATDRFDMWIGATMFPASLGNQRFSGDGTSLETGQRRTISHAGRDVGLRNPTFWGGELGFGYRHTYFGVLLSGTVAVSSRADARPADPQAATEVSAHNVTTFGGGLEVFGSVPLDRVTLSAGALAGLRGFSMPLAGFAPTTCGRRRYPCAETVTTGAAPYIQPRVRLDVTVDRARSFFIGGYVGVDALGDLSLLGGIVLGVRLPSSS